MREYPEVHQRGSIALENLHLILNSYDPSCYFFEDVDIGLAVSEDGRIWVCINGIAFLRFKPNPSGPKMSKNSKTSRN